MVWLIFVAGAVLSWGAYGALLHQGQTQLGNPLKALLCVGVAYFFIGVLIPVFALGAYADEVLADPVVAVPVAVDVDLAVPASATPVDRVALRAAPSRGELSDASP